MELLILIKAEVLQVETSRSLQKKPKAQVAWSDDPDLKVRKSGDYPKL